MFGDQTWLCSGLRYLALFSGITHSCQYSDLMGCHGLYQRKLHARQVPQFLYYFSSSNERKVDPGDRQQK